MLDLSQVSQHIVEPAQQIVEYENNLDSSMTMATSSSLNQRGDSMFLQVQTAKHGRSTWAWQNAKGRDLADDLVADMTANGSPVPLGVAVKAMVATGAYGGVEVGFCQRLAEHLLRS